MLRLRARLARAWTEWKRREITSTRLLGTAVGLVLLGVPFGLWTIVVGPTAGDRLTGLAFLVGALLVAAYSVWESKAPGQESRRPRDFGDGPRP
jgi:hypothetical protein